MSDTKLEKIEKLIVEKKINDAQYEISKLGEEYYRNANYLYLRGKIFYLNKLYYAAIDALLIALEFEQNEKTYNLIGEIYDILGNHELKEEILDPRKRVKAINLLKDQLTGIYRK